MPPDANRQARIPVKLHRRVCLVQTEDAILAEELLARKKLAQDVVGRLTDRVLLPPPFPLPTVISVGDMVIAAGVVWLIAAGMRAPSTGSWQSQTPVQSAAA